VLVGHTDSARAPALTPPPRPGSASWTRGTEGMLRLTPNADQEAALARRIPLGRYGEMDEVADLCLLLASDRARYITGAILPCDGGQSLPATPITAISDDAAAAITRSDE
jgi:NAD(P)-dependent dehydrogenase (short-subunit alcohol dehydrogenase family)